MPSPVLNEGSFRKARAEDGSGWGSPDTDTRYFPPVSDGPTTPYSSAADRMTLSGTMTATGVLFALLLVGGVMGWTSVNAAPADSNVGTGLPGWFFLAFVAALGLCLFTVFKPHLARITAPLYALAEGLVLGAISHVYDVAYDGIVITAVGATAAVFAAMLFLYATRIIKVTDRMRRMVIGATMGVFALYFVAMIVRLFGGSVSIIDSASGMSIIISLVVVAIAAFNLTLDFDMIERGARDGAPRYMEWYAAFGLMVTVVWLYLEILRLLSKLQRR